jgi:hypothetical protein
MSVEEQAATVIQHYWRDWAFRNLAAKAIQRYWRYRKLRKFAFRIEELGITPENVMAKGADDIIQLVNKPNIIAAVMVFITIAVNLTLIPGAFEIPSADIMAAYLHVPLPAAAFAGENAMNLRLRNLGVEMLTHLEVVRTQIGTTRFLSRDTWRMLQLFALSVFNYIRFINRVRCNTLKNSLIVIVRRIATEDFNQDLIDERERLCQQILELGGIAKLRSALRISREAVVNHVSFTLIPIIRQQWVTPTEELVLQRIHWSARLVRAAGQEALDELMSLIEVPVHLGFVACAC